MGQSLGFRYRGVGVKGVRGLGVGVFRLRDLGFTGLRVWFSDVKAY